MSEALATEVHAIVEPGLAAEEAGAQVEDTAIDVLTGYVGQVLAGQQALAAQMAAQHAEMLQQFAQIVMRQSGL